MDSGQDIGRTKTIQEHWSEKRPINDQLRSVIEPLADDFSGELEVMFREAGPDRRAEFLRAAGNIYELPYGRIGKIPPAVFGNITKDQISLDHDLTVPTDEAEIEALAEGYAQWTDKTRRAWRYHYSAYPTKSAVVDILKDLKGEVYPEDQWRAAAEVRQQALREERSFIIDTHCTNRSLNAALDYDQLNDATKATHGAYKNYLLSLSQIEGPDHTTQGTRDVLLLPVGEYGPEAAEKLLRLVMSTSDLVKSSRVIDRGVRDRLDQDSSRLLETYTARSRERSESNMKDFAVHGVKNTLTEGILSAAQTISMLTAQKIEGYTHDELVSMILDSDIIEQFTRLVQPGYIGPTNLSGIYLKDAMVIRDGKPVLTKEAISVLNEMRKRHIEDTLAKWALYEEGKGEKPAVLGLVCPAAAPNGALTTVKRALKPFYTAEPAH